MHVPLQGRVTKVKVAARGVPSFWHRSLEASPSGDVCSRPISGLSFGGKRKKNRKQQKPRKKPSLVNICCVFDTACRGYCPAAAWAQVCRTLEEMPLETSPCCAAAEGSCQLTLKPAGHPAWGMQRLGPKPTCPLGAWFWATLSCWPRAQRR